MPTPNNSRRPDRSNAPPSIYSPLFIMYSFTLRSPSPISLIPSSSLERDTIMLLYRSQSRNAVVFVALACVLISIKHLRQPIQPSEKTLADITRSKINHNDNGKNNRPTCLRAVNHAIPQSQHGHLPRPFINLGMPKVGSTSLQAFFKCGGYNSSHYECGNGIFCADCIKRAISNNLPPLASCGGYDAFVQLDNGGTFFPQIESLEQIHQESPNATFLLTFREMAGWYRSITHWPPNADTLNPPLVMSNRMKRSNITGLPAGMGRDESEFSMWFCNHVTKVRDFVEKHPSHALIEIDIEGSNNDMMLGDLFGIKRSCWGHANKNPGLGGTKL